MRLTVDRAWQLPWLRLHLAARELLDVPTSSQHWPDAKLALIELARLSRAELRARLAACYGEVALLARGCI